MPSMPFLCLAATLLAQTPPNPRTVPSVDTKPSAPSVYAEPNPALPGQTVTIRWPAELGAVIVNGGGIIARRFPAGQTSAQDRPAKSTTYSVTMPVERTKKGRVSEPSRRYQVGVHVYDGSFPRLATYTDTRGWTMDVVAGWNRYVVDLPDPVNNALIYFQTEEDSEERTAVSIVPSDGMDSRQLMRKVETDIPTQYDMLTRTGQKETTQGGIDAFWMTFTGTEMSHPDTPMKSMVLAFVKGPRGYVISARAPADRYDERERLLRCLVRSFAFTYNLTQRTSKQANHVAHGERHEGKRPLSRVSR
jgi:hypothetical protein